MRRLALLVLPLITLFPLSANALTVRDVVELTRAGLGEDIILALIEVDPAVFPIDTATLKSLKDAGVSQRVIVAMIRSGRTQPPPSIDPPPAGGRARDGPGGGQSDAPRRWGHFRRRRGVCRET